MGLFPESCPTAHLGQVSDDRKSSPDWVELDVFDPEAGTIPLGDNPHLRKVLVWRFLVEVVNSLAIEIPHEDTDKPGHFPPRHIARGEDLLREWPHVLVAFRCPLVIGGKDRRVVEAKSGLVDGPKKETVPAKWPQEAEVDCDVDTNGRQLRPPVLLVLPFREEKDR